MEMNEKPTNEQAQNQESANTLEAQALTEMKAKLESLEKENKDLQTAKSKYYDSLLNGNSQTVVEPQVRTAKEIREELVKVGKDASNLEFAKLAVELNDAVIREGGVSIFLPKGNGVTPTYNETDLAERFPEVLKECIETAQGNTVIFNNEFQRHIVK